ncbi:MRC1-like domain, partial [Rhizoctonia solani]
MVRSRTPSETKTIVPGEITGVNAEVCHDSSTPPASSPCWRPTRPTTMPITYGRPRPPTSLSSAQLNVSNVQSTATNDQNPSPTEAEFNQDWKQKLKDIDNDEYDGEMVRESTSSSLTPLVSSSSLSALPESQPQRESPSRDYRDPDTDDPDTSVELNTAVAMPSSDGEPMPEQDDEADSEDEPVVSKRMAKPLRVVDSDEESNNKQSPSQMSVDRPAKSSNPTTPASSAKKPVKLALSDDSDEEPPKDDKEEEQEEIQDASSPQVKRSTKRGLNKAEKVEMAKTQQAIAASREIRIQNATKRVDHKSYFANYNSSLNQAEIDSYPFPPGARSQKPTDSKAKLREKIAAMRPLSSHPAPASAPLPKTKYQVSSDPIVGSSQSGPGPIKGEAESEQKGDLFGKPNALGMSMFGAEDSDEDEFPAVNQVLFAVKPKSKPKPSKVGLEEKKRALTNRKVESDSDDDLEIAGGSRPTNSRILARPGQKAATTQRKIKQEVSESQVLRAGHANHFGLDAAPSSSPIKGGGQYEDSQFGIVRLPGTPSRTATGWKGGKPTQPVGRGNNGARMTMEQLKRFVATKSFDDGQARQRADEERWKANGGRALKREKDRKEGLGVEEAVREALGRAEHPQEEEEDEEDEEDEDYRGSASEQEQSEEEEDKENLPTAGRGRKPHEPVSDFDGSEKGEGDEDKENSLELAGIGSGLSPARIDAASPGLSARSPTHINNLSPGLSPGLAAPSPSHLFGRSPSHLRLSSTGSGRLPLSELEDEDKVPGENAAIARAPLGELDVHEEDEEDVVRRPMKRHRKGVVGDEEEIASPRRKPGSASQRRLDSPSQRKLPLSFSSPSQRLLSSPSQRLLSPSLRFGSPTPRAQKSRLATGTQSFSQVETQDMLGGLGDVFGFESQSAPTGSPSQGGGGLTQLFANSANAGPSDAFSALRVNSNNIELTQDERAKLLYKPKISEEEARRDQELFEREDELMARPFSPTQKEENQMWLNEEGLWTQTKPAQTQAVGTQIEEPSSTPVHMPTTSLGTPSSGSQKLYRIRRGAASAQDSTPERESELAPIPSVFDKLMASQRGKQKKQERKRKLAKSDFVEGEAAESDDEYEGFGLRSKDEEGEEGDSDEDRHLEGLVDDQAMDEDTEAAAQIQAKFMEQNAQDDEAREKLARDVVAGKLRTRRRRGDNMDLDDDDESEEEHHRSSKNFLKKRKIDNDHLDALAKHDSTRAFVDMYDKAIKSTEDDEFAHLNQVTEDIDVAPGMNEDEEDDEEGEEGEEVGVEEEEATAPETPFGHSKKYIPSSEKAEVSFGFKPPNFNHDNDSDEEDPATIDLPDAVPQKLAPVTRGNSVASRIQQWAVQEGGGNRANIGRMGQGVSVTGHGGKNKVTKTKSASSNRPSALTGTSSSSSNKLSRLGSKASGFR